MREILAVHQPCILCEGTLYVSVLLRDDETGAERWEHTDGDYHACPALLAVIRERGTRS